MSQHNAKHDAQHLKLLSTQYAKAFANLSWIGSTHPDEHYEIKERCKRAKERLFLYIEYYIDHSADSPSA